jgi:hypothetical protein
MVDEASLMPYYFKNDYPESMSIWQICHLWHGVNPQHNDILDIPVQKTIMMFSRWIQRGEINICNGNGYTFDIKSNVGGQRAFLKEYYPEYSNKENKDIPTKVHNACDERLVYEGRRNAQYYDFAGEIIEIFKTQNFDKKILKKVFLSAEEVKWFCEKLDIPLPKFWFSKSEPIKSTEQIKTDVKKNTNGNTKLFNALIDVKKKFYNGEKTPNSKDVKEYLKLEKNISQNMINAFTTILTPDHKKKGGAPKTPTRKK